MSHPSRFFADDKDIYDLIISQSRRFPDDVLRDFLLGRGIVVSASTPRIALVRYLAALPIGFHDLDQLHRRTLGRAVRSPRQVGETVSAPMDKFLEAVATVREERTSALPEKYNVVTREGGVIDVVIDYTVIDSKRSRLSQRTNEKLVITMEKDGASVRLRHPDEHRAREIVDRIVTSALGTESAARSSISLSDLDANQRTQFFEELVKGIPGFALRTVTRIAFRRLDHTATDDQLDGELDTTTLPGIETDDGSRILRIQVDGAGIFESTEYERLKKDGFYIAGAAWRARQGGGPNIDVEFDAALVLTDESEPFSYKIRGVFRPNKDASLASTRSAPTEMERNAWLRVLEDRAYEVLKTIRGSVLPLDGGEELGSAVAAEDSSA